MKYESLRSLVVCRGFLHDPVVKALMAVQEDERQGDSFHGEPVRRSYWKRLNG